MRRLIFAVLLVPACEPTGAPSPTSDGGSSATSSGGQSTSRSGGASSGGTHSASGASASLGGRSSDDGTLGGAAGAPPSGGTASGGLGGGPAGGNANRDLVPVFVAQGHAGRTVVSCDNGRTWAGERYAFDTYRTVPAAELKCWSGAVNYDADTQENFEVDCDHHAFAGRGIAYGGEGFLATFGWGDPGAVRHSKNGEDWGAPIVGTTFGGVGYVQGTWIAAAGDSRLSLDDGATFSQGPDTGMQGNVRRVGTTTGNGERLVLVGDNAEARITSDGGKSWWSPDSFPDTCGASIQTEGGIANHGDLWLIVGGDGIACRSTDGGKNWTATSVGTSSLSSQLVWNGDIFMVWGQGKRYSSADGAEWQTTNTSPPDIVPGPAAANPDGSVVAIRGGWDVWYEDQHFYRSDDGITWQEAESYTGGHPIRGVAFGVVPRPPECER
jgi:hypothetical protein